MKSCKYTHKAIQKWLFILCGIAMFAGMPVCAQAQERGISGGYVDDDAITVPANAYTTFSTVYNDKRYYLGVDTTAAKSGKDTVTMYDEPNYATMWIAGPLWSPTGEALPNKDYTRWVKSVWIAERCSRDKYLAVGTELKNYSLLVMRDSAQSTMWHTAKDVTVQSQYMHGYMFAYSDESGVETYRYLTYDPIYGFCRLYSTRPSVSQRISVWDRKTGDDLVFKTNPTVYSFGLKTSSDTTRIRFSSHVAYYPHVDRFRSRYARVDVYTSEPEVIDDQSVLVSTYHMSGHYEWKSNPRGEGAYNGQSHMKMWTFTGDSTEIDHDSDPETPDVKVPVMGWRDSTLLWVSDTKNRLVDNEWVDTIFVIGASPIDRPECRVLRKTGEGEPTEGDYLDHVDWLYVHLYLGEDESNKTHYVDSIQLTRETFHVKYTTSLTMDERPDGWEFPYHYNGKKADESTPIGTDDTKDFEISARYRVTADTVHYNGAYERGSTLEEQTLDLAAQTPQEIAEVKYNELIVNAYEPGTTTPCGWLTVSTPNKKTISLQAAAYDPAATVDRIAEVHYTYRYLHSTQEGDWSELTRIIWVSQLWKNSGVAGLYAFSHKPTAAELQEVYEKNYTVYAIPDEELSLPLHRDHWGYYRWFIYEGSYKDRDLEQEWDFGLNAPVNKRNQNFMPINYATSPASRGRWDVIRDINAGNTEFTPATNEHFKMGTKTAIPAVYYPKSITKSGKVACDVSAYYDIQTTGSSEPAYVKQNLTSLTEPTLSYRNVFDIRPAKIQADTLATYKGDGSGAKWMEEHVVIVPAGREFSLQQRYPVRQGDASIDEEHLQYIYYANPATGDAAKIGTRIGLTDEQLKENDYYARIGKEKTIAKRYVLTLRTASELRGMDNNASKTIILVNPRNNTGYLMGKGGKQIPVALPIPNGATTKAAFKDSLEKKLNDGGTYDSYFITIKQKTRSKKPYHNFLYGDFTLYNLFTSAMGEEEHNTQNIRWYSGHATGSEEFEIGTYSGSSADMPTGFSSGDLITIWTTRWTHTGYLASGQWSGGVFNYRIYKQSNSNTAYQAWLVYEVSETNSRTYNETPRWEKYNGSTWVEVERASDSDEDGYTMLANGALEFDNNVHITANETIQYRLRTEHFQLAKFTVVTRDPDKEGPRNDEAIISEDDIQSNYETLYTLGLENFPAPATDAPTAYNHKLPWNMTELSYHYPQSEIASDRRVDSTSLLPMKGEYCFLNKFVDPTNPSHIISARDNYFMCIQAAEKPTTIFNFFYPGLTCSDQQIYLCFDLCNPMKDNGYEPQITAELQGTMDGGSTWTSIYRFKTGEIKFNRDGEAPQDWWQVVLPIDRSKVKDYDYFRCTASLTGTTSSNAFILIDRLRFIAKERPMTVFQNKASCLENKDGGMVDIIARLDYQNASYPAGTLIAFQYQKKAGGVFRALNPNTDGITYVNDAVTAPEVTVAEGTTDTCGVIRIPAKDYVPSKAKGDSVTTIDHVTDTAKCYVNEGTGSAYYVMYLSQQVYAHPSDTFRVVMAGMRNKDDLPTFSKAECATERIIVIHHPVQLHVSGYTGVWPNTKREDMDDSDDAHTLRAANATYSVTASIADGFLPEGATAGSGKCMFDVVRTTVEDRDYGQDDVWFKNRFGCTRQQFREVMTIFRADHPDNAVKTETNWNNVRPEHFQYDGRSKAQADSIYAILNTLIVTKGLLQIGLSSYDVYLTNNNNSYAVLWPIPASGTYVKSGTTYPISVCATPRWFEIHSGESTYNYTLRFGYDNLQEGNYYMTPIIRASVTDANTALKVRVADITHAAHSGLVIGWDSTYVVDSNDPTWNSTKSFRYHQDRIVQDTLFESYYHVPTSGTAEAKERDPHRYVTFTPVNSTYISQLTTTGCDCYDYDANGTVYDPANPGSANNVFLSTAATSGTCNKWHVLPTAGYQTANNFRLKAGYWYKFRTAFFDVRNTIAHDAGGDGPCQGHSEFIVAVAPDTVRWTPSHPDGANYWNDDNNWTPVMANKPADGFKATVPMNNTKVIIPQVDEGMLPIVSETVMEQKDTLDYGYAKNTCKKILFRPHAQMLGQEKLSYDTAFVDLHFKTGQWQTFSPALDDIYAGDMYIPFSTDYNYNTGSKGESIDTVDFETKPFPYGDNYWGNYNPREYPFAFYQGFYNASVHVPYYNTDTNDSTLATSDAKSKSSVDWVKTPSLRMHYAPGAPCIIQGFDATDEDGRDIVVRLPKTETQYYGYGRIAANTYVSGMVDVLPSRSRYHNLAYDKYAPSFNESTGISYTLSNATESDLFFFGNPTMALVDVWELCMDNKDVLKYEGGKYFFTAYQLMDGSSYATKTVTGAGQYFIAPQRAIGLIAKEVSSSLTIQLQPSALVAITGEGITASDIAPSPMRRRARVRSVYEEPEKRWLYITASNETDWGVRKSYLTLGEQEDASRGYVFGEDALSISSGLNYYDDASYSTPLSMYTIADNQALMQDVRDTLSRVPLIFTTLPDYQYSTYTMLSFSMSGEWDRPLYLYDALTNDSVQIRNGLQVAVRTPNSDQIRYFINGAPKKTETENHQDITTDIENLETEISGYRNTGATIIYDMLGRKVMTLTENDLISTIQLPTGVYIIQRGNKAERMVMR